MSLLRLIRAWATALRGGRIVGAAESSEVAGEERHPAVAVAVWGGLLLLAYIWFRILTQSLCGESLASCLSSFASPDQTFPSWLGGLGLLVLTGILRPMLLTPPAVIAAMGGGFLGGILGGIVAALLAAATSVWVAEASRYMLGGLVGGWLKANLPSTSRLIRDQEHKILFLLRWLPLFHFDLVSVASGAVGMRRRTVFLCSFLAFLPEGILVASLGPSGDLAALGGYLTWAAASLLPLLAWEWIVRRKGRSLISQARRMIDELRREVSLSNRIDERGLSGDGRPVILLLYGFFSSRRVLDRMDRMLRERGYDVLTLDLGGFLGVFNTHSIKDLAELVDERISEIIARNGISEISVVAHSKGGLIALWWVIMLGGSRHCRRVITTGTPFSGSWLTYLAILTPLGLLWRDVWQMRPGSRLLATLARRGVPEGVEVVCIHSDADRVTRGGRGIFRPLKGMDGVSAVKVDGMPHFGYFESPEVADLVSGIIPRGTSR